MHIVILAGGVGGSRFVRGVRAAWPDAHLDIISNTADDITLHGLRICPDLDTMMYALGDGIDPDRGWGRADEGWRIMDELRAYEVAPTWFNLGDRDVATHLIRTQLLNAGYGLSDVTAALCSRWIADDDVRLWPMTEDRVETHIVVTDDSEPAGQRSMHFQEFWVRHQANLPVRQVVVVGIDQACPSPGVTEAIAAADLILVAPSNPVVSIGPILNVPGIRAALRAAGAPVVGFSGILDGAPVLGMADKLLPAIGVRVDAGAVGVHYGSRARGGILDAWVMDSADAAAVSVVAEVGLRAGSTDLMMRDPQATAAFLRFGVGLLG